MSCIHIYSPDTREMHTHMHSIEKHAMSIHIHSLETHVIKIIYSFSRYTCHDSVNTHIHSLNIETHVMNAHIYSLNNHEMNTQIHFSDINNKERERWLESVKLQSRPAFAQFSRFAWLGSSALIGFTLIHLAPSPRWQVCTAWSSARWLSVRTTIITVRKFSWPGS